MTNKNDKPSDWDDSGFSSDDKRSAAGDDQKVCLASFILSLPSNICRFDFFLSTLITRLIQNKLYNYCVF
jgi:hypothetical protein